jgi:hypothetical protein
MKTIIDGKEIKISAEREIKELEKKVNLFIERSNLDLRQLENGVNDIINSRCHELQEFANSLEVLQYDITQHFIKNWSEVEKKIRKKARENGKRFKYHG